MRKAKHLTWFHHHRIQESDHDKSGFAAFRLILEASNIDVKTEDLSDPLWPGIWKEIWR